MAITPLDGQARGDLLLVAPLALHRAASVDPADSTTITFLFPGDTVWSSDLEELIRQIMAKQD